MKRTGFNQLISAIVIIVLFTPFCLMAEKKPFTFMDAMKFQMIKRSLLSEDGKWTAFYTAPDRGDPIGYVKSTSDSTSYKIDLATDPVISKDSKWVGFTLKPKSIESENAEKKKPKSGMTVLNLLNGTKTKFENVKEYRFSEDSKWLAVYQNGAEPGKKDDDSKNTIVGSNLIIRELATGSDLTLINVTEFAFDSLSNFLAYTLADDKGKTNGLYVLKLNGSFTLPKKVMQAERTLYSSISWTTKTGVLAYIGCKENKKDEADSCQLYIWDSKKDTNWSVLKYQEFPQGYFIPFKNDLSWTEDGNRLFFGLKPYTDTIPGEDKITYTDTNYYDSKTILKKADYDLWHYNDPLIKTNERNWWDKNKERTFRSLYNLETKSFLFLSDLKLSEVQFTDNPNFTYGQDDTPYLKERTWDGFYFDLYSVNLKLGTRKLIAKRLSDAVSLSPQGNYIVYYNDKHWYLYNNSTDSTSNLTFNLPYPFYNEDNDVPEAPGSYGVAGWFENDRSVFINDKYDIWKFSTVDESYLCQTALDGRENKIQFRILKLNKDQKYFNVNQALYMSGYSDTKKYTGIYALTFKIIGPEVLLSDTAKKIKLIAESKVGRKVLFSSESYQEFPDLQFGDSAFKKTKKITDLNPQIKDYKWGSAELISWVNNEGDTLQGYIIKPDGFSKSKRYPVVVYYYEKFTQMMYNFPVPYIGHRPCPMVYTSDDYVLFMPDIKFRIGSPGYSSVSCITTGLKKLIDMGIADPEALGITGHSWSGYQTAYMITQTNMFKAAVAGAPVGNMTSAYSGIRLESGLARQFQYEMQQSRIGGNLWDSLNSYIRNSPVFQAKGANTPFLIMFGDADPMVPWQQGIELYLAMRRLNKECLFLQYHKEYHWPEKFPNRLDYGLKMKEFFDTYLLKKKAPDWIINGIRYLGKKD